MLEQKSFSPYGFPLGSDVVKVVDLGYRPRCVLGIYRKHEGEENKEKPDILIIDTSPSGLPNMPPYFRPVLGVPIEEGREVKFYVDSSALAGEPHNGKSGSEKVIPLRHPGREPRVIFLSSKTA